LLDTVRNVRETSISESMNEEDTVVVEEMSVEVKVTYNCHRCHKEMEARDISPFLEWHICDKCIKESETFK
jgi:uncharacterized protein YjaG (DUF416 family)